MSTESLRSFAYVNHGRWVADCAVCPSALLVKPLVGDVWPQGDPKAGQRWSKADPFVCQDVLCGAVSELVWPDELGPVEALLRERPQPSNRNWHPGETAGDLLAENIEHGVTPVKGLT